MISHRPSLLLGWSLLAFAAAPAVRSQSTSANGPADAGEPVRLETLVVSADRTPEDAGLVPASVTTLFPASLATEQVTDLRTALTQVPGVSVVNTGAFGSVSSVFIRGANAADTLFVVDGIPEMTDPFSGGGYSNYLGGAGLAGLDRVEVLRGPQSTLYGSAPAGVISIDTARGCGTPSGTLSAEAGSFGTAAASSSVQGAAGPADFSASLSRMSTDNDRPDNKFQGWSASARLEGSPAPWALVGATVRTDDSTYDEPSARLDPVYAGQTTADNTLVTAYGQVQGGGATSRLTGAVQRTEYNWAYTTPDPDFGLDNSQSTNNRRVAEWQNNLWNDDKTAELVAGTEAEASRFLLNGSEDSDSLDAGYLTVLLRPEKSVEITAGGRRDDYRSAGCANTGRIGASWQVVSGTTVRANWGSGFSAPSWLYRYGYPPYGELPNPDIRPERSRGGDFGIEQSFDNGKVVFTATAFEDRFSDMFDYVLNPDFTITEVNLDRAVTRGGEFTAVAQPIRGITLRADYTYMDAWATVQGTGWSRLPRRPRNSGSGDIEWQPTRAWTFGAGAYASSNRLDTDPSTFGPITLPSYLNARVFASWQATSRLILRVRVENALNRDYQETAGYPALARGAFGGAEWTF